MTDQGSNAALTTEITTKLNDNTSQGVSPQDTREVAQSLQDTLVNMHDYLCYSIVDGTRSNFFFTDPSTAATRASELVTWLATRSDDSYIHIGAGTYTHASGTAFDFAKDNCTYDCRGVQFTRLANTDTAEVVLVSGDRNKVIGMEIDGNYLNNQTNATNSNSNLHVTGDNNEFHQCWIHDTPIAVGGSGGTTPRCVTAGVPVTGIKLVDCLIQNGGYSLLRLRNRRVELRGCTLEYTRYPSPTAQQFTATVSSATWTTATHTFANDDRVFFTTTGTMPTTAGRDTDIRTLYHVVNKTATTFEISLTQGGTAITTTSAGSGTHTAWRWLAQTASTGWESRTISTDLGEIESYVIRDCTYRCSLPISCGCGGFNTSETAAKTDVVTFTVSGDWVNGTAHPFENGDSIWFTNTGGALPTDVDHQTTYYVINSEANKFNISALPDGDVLTITGTGSGTHTANHLFRLRNLLVEGCTIDIPNRPGAQSNAWFKIENFEQATFRNLHFAWNRSHHSTDIVSLISITSRTHLQTSTRGGFDPRVVIEGVTCPSGGIEWLGGEVVTLDCRASLFGNMDIAGAYLLNDALGRDIHFRDCRFETGDFVICAVDSTWDVDVHSIFFSGCDFYHHGTTNRHIITTGVRGGFYDCRIHSQGSGTLYYSNSADKRLQTSLAHPGSYATLVYRPDELGTGTGTNSVNHPALPFTFTGYEGQHIISDTGRHWVWDEANTEWTSLDALHGGISVESNATATTIGSSSTDFSNKVQVTTFDTNETASLGTTPDHTNDHITIDEPGDFSVSFAYSMSGGANDVISAALFKNNGATQITPRCTRKLDTGGNVGCDGSSAVVTLAAADTVELWVQNESAAANVTVEDAVVTVKS